MPSSVINSDDGVISGTSGLKSSGGDDGVLVFQSKGTETARINTDKQIVAAAGTASLPALTTTGDVNTGIFFPAADTIAFAEGGAEAMRITSDRNVGIGTSSPGTMLEVYNVHGVTGVNPEITIHNGTNTVKLVASAFTTFANLGTSTAHPLTFRTDNTERARITSAGYLLVGTTSGIEAASRNEFRASQTAGGEGVLAVYNSASSGADASPPLTIYKAMTTTTSSARFVQFYANAGIQPMGGIVGNGVENVQFATISDVREKTNIQTISGSLDKIAALNPVSFDWIKNGEHCPAGFVAQDVEQVFPEFVIENFSQEGQEPRKGLTGGMTGGIIPHLVKAIQELSAKNDALEARIAALEAVPGNE
jgi:hypothetical protein